MFEHETIIKYSLETQFRLIYLISVYFYTNIYIIYNIS